MAEQFQRYGFNARSLTSDTPQPQRKQLAEDLRNSRIHYLCVVDIFNEGVDIPEVDTVLFLRPTESLTIFLQQLGRGLRLSPGKTELTVLDFVAQANQKYDFAGKFRALSLRPEKNIIQQITDGFTFLPAGCSIIMEKVAREHILNNIQQAIYNKSRLIKEINTYHQLPTSPSFWKQRTRHPHPIYAEQMLDFAQTCGWTNQLPRYSDHPSTGKGMGNLVHHNTSSFLHFVKDFTQGSKEYLNKKNLSYTTMLYYDLYQERIDKTEFKDAGMYKALDILHEEEYRYFKQEMAEIVSYRLEIWRSPPLR